MKTSDSRSEKEREGDLPLLKSAGVESEAIARESERESWGLEGLGSAECFLCLLG